MSTLGRKLSLAGRAALLAAGGVMLGGLASNLTTEARVWQPPMRSLEPTTEAMPVDHAASGRAWARVAYEGGLRGCPVMNPAFVAGCEAELKALAARPAFQPGTYGGPLLITEVEPMPRLRSEPAYKDDWEPAQASEPAPEPESVLPPVIEPTPANYPAADPAP